MTPVVNGRWYATMAEGYADSLVHAVSGLSVVVGEVETPVSV